VSRFFFIILDLSTNLRAKLILRIFNQDVLASQSKLQSCWISFRSDGYFIQYRRHNWLNVGILYEFEGGLNIKIFRARYFIYTVKTEIQNKNLGPKPRKFRESWAP